MCYVERKQEGVTDMVVLYTKGACVWFLSYSVTFQSGVAAASQWALRGAFQSVGLWLDFRIARLSVFHHVKLPIQIDPMLCALSTFQLGVLTIPSHSHQHISSLSSVELAVLTFALLLSSPLSETRATEARATPVSWLVSLATANVIRRSVTPKQPAQPSHDTTCTPHLLREAKTGQ